MICVRCVVFLLIQAPLWALSLDDFTTPPGVWSDADKPRLNELIKDGYRWTSEARDTLRATKGGKIAGIEAGETLVRLDSPKGKPVTVEIFLYSRGDNGDISEKDFDARLVAVRKALADVTGVKPVETKRSRLSAVRADAAVWAGPGATCYLEWSKNREERRPEFIKLELRPAEAAKKLIKDLAETTSAAVPTAKGYVPAAHLETNAEGDKWIKDVPMVDQGQKGYCAVASTERVLRLYGLPVDEHELAQLADSSAEGGTSSSKMIAAFKRNASRLKVRTQVIQEWDSAWFDTFANDYNSAARKAKQPLIPLPKKDWVGFVQAMDSAKSSMLRFEGRKSNASGVKRFEKQIAAAIDKGLPVLWGVSLGMAPEVPALPQSEGGHMRLILGYNAKNHTVIYSDSWGRGHERKVMPADAAFAITNELLTLIP